ncbi:MAG: aldose epimerase family protein [Phocaeicola sp.]
MADTCKPENIKCKLNWADFQKNIEGKKSALFILKNKNGLELAATNYGGAVVALMTPDKKGEFANIIQGHDTVDNVINSPEPFLSTLVGRYGNRIANGEFGLEGKNYKLTINNGPNSLHGGPTGFHARVWDAEQIDSQTLKLHYLSKDGEEGFPGNLDVTVTYLLTDDNEFVITYTGTTDQPTVANLTHHAFFSLSGIANPTARVENNIVTINADFYTPIDKESIPTGEIAPVAGTPMDFRTPQSVGSRINDSFEQLIIGAGYDHCYVLNKKEQGALTFAAKCVEPISGRSIEVYTTEPGIQLYTSNWHSGFKGSHGATFPARSAICFEAQYFPDTPNKGHFPSCVLKPTERYHQVTIYKFGVEE